jgi:fluoroacetyl-CoA thioesterase
LAQGEGTRLSSETVPVEAGLCAEVELTVTAADTARAMHSGDVEVLATPRVVALCEEASCAALSGRLEVGETSVGTRIELSHLAPIAVGSTVRASATLEKNEGRRLIFNVTVSDASGLVAAGKITRVVVNEKEFLSRLR